MTRLMVDSIHPEAIPATAQLVAGYIDGRYKWSQANWNRFPPATPRVRIAVFASTNDGNCGDVEPGAITPEEAPAWVRMRRAAGVDPSIYCNLSTWPAVQNEFMVEGTAHPHYWVAGYRTPPDTTIPPGAVAHQYTSTGLVDLSSVVDYWPGIDPPGGPMTTPTAPCVDGCPTLTGQGYYLVGADGGVFTEGDAVFYGSLGGKNLTKPITSIKLTPTGKGYWLFGGDYGVFTFGDAEYFGHP